MVYGYALELKCIAFTLDVSDTHDEVRGFHILVFVVLLAESTFF